MSGDVLDLIDGAIHAHGDAMRWSPNPEQVAPAAELPAVVASFGASMQAVNEAIVAFQAELIRQWPVVHRAVTEAKKHYEELIGATASRVARLRAMHCAYSRRRR